MCACFCCEGELLVKEDLWDGGEGRNRLNPRANARAICAILLRNQRKSGLPCYTLFNLLVSVLVSVSSTCASAASKRPCSRVSAKLMEAEL